MPAPDAVLKMTHSLALGARNGASRDDALAHRIKYELRNAMDVQLLENMGTMSFDGVRLISSRFATPYLSAPRRYAELRGYGKERPVCQEHGEACWQRNRRIHIVATAQAQK
jgi:hypothetical protein